MRLIAVLLSVFVLGGQSYLPPCPRPGTKALTKGRADHAVFVPAGTIHSAEPIRAATIFELT
jgi:hypothetical protein